ncbi:MAG: nitrate reductase molybdenum cofactor assembly chaperone [Planctomycetaceae bacterium]
MTEHRRDILNAFAALLNYPDSGSATAAGMLGESLKHTHPDALGDLRAFEFFIATHDGYELEEYFTRTFEISPQCALEIGWHLFGEEYARGQFLVRLREELRKHGIAESAELPDHISHVLPILAAMPADDGKAFAAACVIPALCKMLQAFEGHENAYESLLRCLRLVLCREFDVPEDFTFEEDVPESSQADPLWAYAVQGVPACDSQPQLVPLEMKFGETGVAPSGIVAGGEPL